MDIRDYDALVANVRLGLQELSPAQLASLGSAVRAEQERRQWPAVVASVTSSDPQHPGASAVRTASAPPALALDPETTERWRSTPITVHLSWPEHHTPWICSRCGAEWCRVRNPPTCRPGRVLVETAPVDAKWIQD